MGLPPPPSIAPPSGTGSSSAGKSSRALTGDVDLLSRISPDGTPVNISGFGAATLLVPAPVTGYVRVIQRAFVSDVALAGGSGQADLFISSDAIGTVCDELIDRGVCFPLATDHITQVTARIQKPIALRSPNALWCNGLNAAFTRASARYFDILVQD